MSLLGTSEPRIVFSEYVCQFCLLYTSDAADEMD